MKIKIVISEMGLLDVLVFHFMEVFVFYLACHVRVICLFELSPGFAQNWFRYQQRLFL